ncbi:MAG: NUDIX domain-containing protein [Sphingopyxis sp.]|nr:NUDIX domain-containing protein [Sphingopyxis sp.]
MAGEAIDILLVTSRETGRWVLPKGNIDDGESADAAAAREAEEEAGASGALGTRPIGSYRYAKRADDGSANELTVAVFPLRVRQLAAHWPERKERTRKWFSRAEAAAAVEEEELRELIAGFAG